jgi:hypothetical protein
LQIAQAAAQVAGIVEMWVIENVVALDSQLSPNALGKRHPLGESQIEVGEAGPVEVVAPGAARRYE